MAVYVLAVLHSFGSGTDGASLWFTVMVILTGIPIAVLLALRYGRTRARPSPKATRPRPPGRAQRPSAVTPASE